MSPFSFYDYISGLYKLTVGEIGISREDFYNSNFYEIDLTIQGYQNRINTYYRNMYNISFAASYNGTGFIQGGKRFKSIDPFNDSKASTTKVDPIKKKEELNYLLDLFKQNKVGEKKNV